MSIRIIKAKELTWGGDSATIITDKPLDVIANEFFLLTPKEQEEMALRGIEYLKDARFVSAETVIHIGSRAVGITKHVLDKWQDWSGRHQTLFTDIGSYVSRSKQEKVLPKLRHALSYLFRVKPFEQVERRLAWTDKNTSLQFLIADGVLIEFVTFRGLRQLVKLADHQAAAWKTTNMPEAERIKQIGKQKFRRQVQGGLLQGKLSPRVRRK